MSREGKLAQNTLILSIGTFLPKFAALVTLPILTGYLTKEEMGTYDLVTVLVSLILPSATLQIQTAAFRFLIDVRDDEVQCRKIVTNIMVFIIPVSIAALAVLYMFLPGDRTLVKILICLYFFADIIVNAERQIARGLNHNMEYSISAIVSAVGKMLFAMIFVWQLRLGLTGAVTALMSASILSAIVLSAAIRINELIDLSLVDKAVMRELIQYSWPMVPNSMSMWVMRVSDRFVVTLFMGVSANAVYSVANKIPSLLTLAQNTFTMAWQENASIVSKDDDAEAYYTQMFKTMFNIMAGFLGLLICATPLLFAILIRGDYGEAYFQMPILFLGMFFFSMCTFLGGIYVDVFPLDAVPTNRLVRWAHFMHYEFLRQALYWIHRDPYRHGHGPSSWIFLLTRRVTTLPRLQQKIRRILTRYDYDSTKYVADYTDGLKGVMPKSVEGVYAPYEFEGKTFMGVKDYQHYLSQMYGDYMKLPPMESRKQHNFDLLELDRPYREFKGMDKQQNKEK